MVRLQKYMADCGVASRRASEAIILAGRVTVNGVPAVLGQSVEESDIVLVDNKPIRPQTERVVVMLYKPRGVVSTSSDEAGRKTVLEYVRDLPYRLYNVGRLDLNSEGLLLLTNDGELANRLMHPRYGIQKTYRVVCDGSLSASASAAVFGFEILSFEAENCSNLWKDCSVVEPAVSWAILLIFKVF